MNRSLINTASSVAIDLEFFKNQGMCTVSEQACALACELSVHYLTLFYRVSETRVFFDYSKSNNLFLQETRQL